MKIFWNQEKVSELIKLIKSKSIEECANYFGVTKKSISIKCSKLGVSTVKNKKTISNCTVCGKKVEDYSKVNRKYCSRRCGVIHNNTIRTTESRNQQKESLLKTLSIKFNTTKPEKVRKIRKPVKERKCKNCKNSMYNTFKFICEECKENYYKLYRQNCNFTFNINEFIHLFSEKELLDLKELKMYSALNRGNNINGVSKDHRFSVKRGFELGIKCFIISHPANCELLPQKTNSSKHTSCSVTLDELYTRIIDSEKVKKYLKEDELNYILDSLNPI